MFVSGGISGFFLAQPSIDTYLHGTYFVVGHFHFVMGVAAMFGIFAGTYFWFPKMYGRMMNETLGKMHFALTLIGVYCIFMPMHYLGLAGNVRRYSAFTDDYMKGSLPLHRFITVRRSSPARCSCSSSINLFWSRLRGAKAPDNPWEATSLEWSHHLARRPSTTSAAAPGGVPRPQRVRGDRARQGDYVMQAVPDPAGQS